MPYVADISLSICVHSQILSPDEITKLAGVPPTDSHCKGDKRSPVRKEVYVSNYWALRVKMRGEVESSDCTEWFSDGIVRLLKQVPADFVSQLANLDPATEPIVWVGLFDVQDQGAFNIRADASRMLGLYELELEFDMYIDYAALETRE